MYDDNANWSGLLGGKRVPIDPRAIFLGMLVVVLFGAGVFGLNHAAESLHFYDAPIAFDAGISGFLGTLYTAPLTFQVAAFVWFLILWSWFGGAINRIIAVRLAKDDSIKVSEALGYSRRRFLSYFLTPIVLIGLIAFLVGCNMLAGLVGSIPWVGGALYILLYVLVLISTLFIVILLIGLIFGFNMISSAISTEGCDGIEASISVYNYIFARPWPFMLFCGMTLVSVWLLLFMGEAFINLTYKTTGLRQNTISYDYHYEASQAAKDDLILQKVVVRSLPSRSLLDGIVSPSSSLMAGSATVDATVVTYYADPKDYEARVKAWTEELDRWTAANLNQPELEEARKKLADIAEEIAKHPERKAERAETIAALKKRIAELEKIVDASPGKKRPERPQQLAAKNFMVGDYIHGTPVRMFKPSGPERTEFSTEHIAGADATMTRILAWVMLAVYWALQTLIVGYALTHILASFTTIYFIMRREVDGTEYEELYEHDEEHFDFSVESAAAGGASAPAAAPAAAPAPAPAPAADTPAEDAPPEKPAEDAPAEGGDKPAEDAPPEKPAEDGDKS